MAGGSADMSAAEWAFDDLLLGGVPPSAPGWQRDIPWSALNARSAHALQRLHLSGGGQTIPATFRLEWFSRFTGQDLMDIRGVGVGTVVYTRDALRSLALDAGPVAEQPEPPRFLKLRYGHEPVQLDRELIKLYRGSHRAAQTVKAKKISDSHALVEYLLANSGRMRPDIVALTDFANVMADRLESHQAATLPGLHRARFMSGAEGWATAVRDEFGLEASDVLNAYPKFEANALAVDLRLRGETWESIGRALGVTRERARQIIHLVGPMLGQETYTRVLTARRELSLDEAESAETERVAAVSAIELAICTGPGMTIDDLAGSLGLTVAEVRRLTPRRLSKFVLGFERSNTWTTRNWTDDQLLEAVRLAGTFYFPLSAPQFDHLVRTGEVAAPGSQTVAKRFGTWKNACLAAGVEATNRGRQHYASKWSWDEIVAFVVEYLLDPATTGAFADYERWRLEQLNAVPSGPLVRNYLGSWGDAVGLALIQIAERGPLDPTAYSAIDEGGEIE